MKKQITFILFLFCLTNLVAQNTVGLLSYNPSKAYDGYNLIYPHNQSTVYLLNNCGEIVHSWEDDVDQRPGNMAYILENGEIFKAKRLFSSAVNDPIFAGGAGETVELRSWNNELLASFTLNNEKFRLHHDIEPLPNGNLLMIAWENKTEQEAQEVGRDISQLSQGKMWSERILEWNPTTNQIVWEWSVFDHLVQDFNENIANFGIISEHPELINVNYDEKDGHPDWLHINSIAYNPVLDQIVLSVPNFNEFWIIDHSTTTEQAATHTEGNSGKGGDLLYRWGNPVAYNQGVGGDKKLFFQHDVHWINPKAQDGDKYFGHIALFNNRVESNLSTGNIIILPYNVVTNNYELVDSVFAPIDFEQVYAHPEAATTLQAASAAVSSFQVLPNNNVLFCSGRRGYSYELNQDNQVVWEYFTPIRNGSVVTQGDTTITLSNNLTFRLTRYDKDFPAFIGKDLSPKGYIELNPDEEFCGGLSVDTEEVFRKDISIKIYPNPTTNTLIVDKGTVDVSIIYLSDLNGKIVQEIKTTTIKTAVDIRHLQAGLYFLSTSSRIVGKVVVY